MKITSQNKGSVFEGIQNTVAKAIASPKSDKRSMSFLFIVLNYFIKTIRKDKQSGAGKDQRFLTISDRLSVFCKYLSARNADTPI